MAFTLDDLIDAAIESRAHFLKHLHGLKDNQWDWKPYAECKSITETVAHLITDDRAYLESLQTGKEPDYEALQESERDRTKLLAILDASHKQLLDYITSHYSDKPLDLEISTWGTPLKLGRAIAHLTSEDFYHSGQVAFIRMATDPSWDYYATIYGGE